jgi:hypothetical protein
MVLWGGPTDQCGVDFDVASANLVGAMASSGNFLVECVHNCGHAAPPVEDPVAGLTVLYQFALDHPYWLPAGQSPWLSTGMPAGTPGWCGMGAGSAVPRTGMCIETSADNGCPSL